MKNSAVSFFVLLCLVGFIVAPPVDPKRKDDGKKDQLDEDFFPLDYGRYLQEVVKVLEQDEEFSKRLKNISEDKIRSGDLAYELEFASHGVRTKLDEIKRFEVERLRAMVRLANERANNPAGDTSSRQWRTVNPGDGYPVPTFKLPSHLDLNNQQSFEIEDLKKLIQAASKDIDELNAKGHEKFKRYEMEKEHKYREELKKMTEEERKVAEAKHQEMVAKHKDHPAVHHPGSKQQLEQVWEEVDQLPKDEFDPKTFFRMHDINGDGYWDEQEVKALVALEVRKMYNVSNPEDDPVEMQEEFNRMEEHIFKEADKDRDNMISLNEFLDMTRKPDFEQDQGWKGLDEEQVYTPEELMEYERQLAAAQAGYHPNAPYPGGYHPDQYPQGGYPPNQYPQGGYPPNQHPQGGYPPNQHPQGGYPPNQQYAYQPVQGVPPSNQGVQFQPLPGQQQQQQQHPGQGSQPQHPQGQQAYPGQPAGQAPHPGQGVPPQATYGGPPGQPPVGAGAPPPHYPPQYAPGPGAVPPPAQFAGHPNQVPMGGAPPPHAQGIPPNPAGAAPQAVPAQPAAQSGQQQGTVQPQAPTGGSPQQQQQQAAQGTAPK